LEFLSEWPPNYSKKNRVDSGDIIGIIALNYRQSFKLSEIKRVILSKQSSTKMDKVWRAFYTKPRHEIKTLNRIIESGLEGYCPLVKSKVKWSDRWKKVTKPAMAGYVFAKVNEEERVQLLNDESIFRTVMWNKKLVAISDEEIELMQLVLDDAEMVHVDSLTEGDLVTVQRGTMSGHNGVVVQISNKTVRLKIDSFHCDMTVTVPLNKLDKVRQELSKNEKN